MQCLVCACSLATLDTTVRQLKSIIDPQPKAGDFANANFPVDLEGRTLHLGCKVGQPGRYAVLQEATWCSHAMLRQTCIMLLRAVLQLALRGQHV